MTGKRVLHFVGWTVVWLMTALLVLAMAKGGAAKFSDDSGWARAFLQWGYPVWFRVLIGVLELAAAGLLLWPRSAPLGALLVIVIMLGGIATHWIHHDRSRGQSEIGPILFATIVLVSRRRHLRAFVTKMKP